MYSIPSTAAALVLATWFSFGPLGSRSSTDLGDRLPNAPVELLGPLADELSDYAGRAVLVEIYGYS